MKHKWHKEIKAWADGAEIECKYMRIDNQWSEWIDTEKPIWDSHNEIEYRIKPQPKEPDFDATEYQKALKKSAQKFKEKIERTYAEVLDKAINELVQPKEPQYLYVYQTKGEALELGYAPHEGINLYNTRIVGKIKLEVDDV